ncbi:MAG: purine nucleoside phosphorylase 1, purine-nucleoside phosphorylase [Candidatus Gottesmanbacteria bacterium GW2011_GWA2_43_14]|uniref:Purine nucleoside phosphorylase n=1 Tax=Candidatus Gottesmanbacteria bacterium GW2011_GWA2_43_14 TaxID=1618443 RepID=A0A0G1G880_9BACT|nr:MAG: purine nucleoside phosphorylase 1, purine-nucleoside phosphorylase [Candidatus Gottesmanbacteria bacterium GW2011_GWA2_43_14]
MAASELPSHHSPGMDTSLSRSDVFFDPQEYMNRIWTAADFINERLPEDFTPKIVLTLGSGGLGEVASLIDREAIIPYEEIPGFKKPTAEGHAGNLIAGYIERVPVIGLQGRRHFYEEGGQPNPVIAMKDITFPVYVARALNAILYFATNAAGGLNPEYKTGDLMVINSHLGLNFPNPLAGPQVPFADPDRFQPQDREYNPKLRDLLHKAAKNLGETDHVHEGVYCAVSGPSYETDAESRYLRIIGADAVGMSTVPEIIVATNLGMDTLGLSLITNVVAEDGTNATSHHEVMAALENPATKKRISGVTREFINQYRFWSLLNR